MFFNTIQYLLFLPAVLLIYYLVLPKYRWIVLFITSCLFYMYFIPKYILCLFFLILVDYFLALRIDRSARSGRKKLYLAFSIISNFGLLIYFKYLDFFAGSLNALLLDHTGHPLNIHEEILPIGLSFHTFQSVSYVVDVYKQRIRPERHLGVYSSYVLFFPQMVAGPIERYATLGSELRKTVRFSFDFVKKAIPLFLIGLFYKTVIADNCGEYVNHTYATLPDQNAWNVIAAMLLFSLQIYSDFFGYSLMAQASARLFGIHLIDNFSFPFFSSNIVEFWKKWHISLTSWFRDYVYIPLGGNRGTKAKHLVNILLVFTLSGLWHGAGLNFILWGFLHAVCYLVTAFLLEFTGLRLPRLVGGLFTFVLVSVIFVFFRSGNLSESLSVFHQMLDFRATHPLVPVSGLLGLNLLILLLVEMIAHKHLNYRSFLSSNTRIFNMVLYAYFLFALLTFSGVDNLPFIYFQF